MTAKTLPQPLIDLLNKCEPGQRVMLFAVPLRIIRVTATDDNMKCFRVEQLVITNKDPQKPCGNWATLSTHGSEVPGQSWQVACEAAAKAQAELKAKLIKKAQAMNPNILVPA